MTTMLATAQAEAPLLCIPFIVYPKAEIVHGFLILCFGTPALADCYPLEAPESSEENPNNERNG